MKKKIAIIHFSPLELYPPVMNLLNYLADNNQLEILVFSTKPNKSLKLFQNSDISFIRYQPLIATDNLIVKLLRYLTFYVFTFLKLLSNNPTRVLYFETLSALPAIWYKRIKKSAEIFVHYHEIVTIEELNQGRTLNKFINQIEEKLYAKFKWISQTNETRLSIFAKQYRINLDLSSLCILPNYPPQSWLDNPKLPREENGVIKLIHIGAISLNGMYLEEVLDRFGSDPNYSIDFYSHNFTQVVKEKIQSYKNCSVKGSIEYRDIPSLKGKYDVGLVIYKGGTTNVIFSAPNKIFEYLALDLDVWCSNKLITARQYERVEYYPKILMVDFEKLIDFDCQKALNRNGLDYLPSNYSCESVYSNLFDTLNENTHT